MEEDLRLFNLCNCWILLRNNDGILFAYVQDIAGLLVLQTVLGEPDPEDKKGQRDRTPKGSRKLQ